MHRQNYTYGHSDGSNIGQADQKEEISKIRDMNSSRNFIRTTSSR
jgi:hypothetical protein